MGQMVGVQIGFRSIALWQIASTVPLTQAHWHAALAITAPLRLIAANPRMRISRVVFTGISLANRLCEHKIVYWAAAGSFCT
jgi:hypothetical protein